MKTTTSLLVVAGLMTGCATVDSTFGASDVPEGKGAAAMATMYPARTVSVSVACEPGKVYEFVANPENLPKWARGLGASVRRSGAAWVVDTPRGAVTVRFAEKNAFGVLDHYVAPAGGAEVYVPLRVIANGSGSEVLFTLFRLPEMSEAEYAEDQRLVEQDLLTLKEILEK